MPEPITNEAAIAASMLPAAFKWIMGMVSSLIVTVVVFAFGWVWRAHRDIQKLLDADEDRQQFRKEMVEWMKRLEEEIKTLTQIEAAREAVEADREKHQRNHTP
jgi:hypothetical protein